MSQLHTSLPINETLKGLTAWRRACQVRASCSESQWKSPGPLGGNSNEEGTQHRKGRVSPIMDQPKNVIWFLVTWWNRKEVERARTQMTPHCRRDSCQLPMKLSGEAGVGTAPAVSPCCLFSFPGAGSSPGFDYGNTPHSPLPLEMGGKNKTMGVISDLILKFTYSSLSSTLNCSSAAMAASPNCSQKP